MVKEKLGAAADRIPKDLRYRDQFALERLAKAGLINHDQVFEINELLNDLNRHPISMDQAKSK